MRRQRGFTLAEVLIALAVMGIAFGALALVQVTNLRATVAARLLTETKAAANVVLEELMAQTLATRTVGGALQFDFNDYYWSCPTPVPPPADALQVVTPRTCTGTRTIGDVTVVHSIRGESGVLGEGVLTISVTATHNHGRQTLTLGDRITCYDIYPSPTATAPAPCPAPGGGRP